MFEKLPELVMLERSPRLLPEELVQRLDANWPEVGARLAVVKLWLSPDYLMRGILVPVGYPDMPLEPEL